MLWCTIPCITVSPSSLGQSVVDKHVFPPAIPPDPDLDHASVAWALEDLVGVHDSVQEVLTFGDGGAGRQKPAVAQDS